MENKNVTATTEEVTTEINNKIKNDEILTESKKNTIKELFSKVFTKIKNEGRKVKNWFKKQKNYSRILIVTVSILLVCGIGFGAFKKIRRNKIENYLTDIQEAILYTQEQSSEYISQIASSHLTYNQQITYKSMDLSKSVHELKEISNVSIKECQRLQVLIESMGNSYLQFSNKAHSGLYCGKYSDVSVALGFLEDADSIYRDVKDEMSKLAKKYNIKLKHK